MMSLSPMTRMEHTAGQRAQVSGEPWGWGTFPSQHRPEGDSPKNLPRTESCVLLVEGTAQASLHHGTPELVLQGGPVGPTEKFRP